MTITHKLLTSYRFVSPKTVALSTAWYNNSSSFDNVHENRKTSGRDISWSLLHFKQHVQASLHTDAELLIYQYPFLSTEGSTLVFYLNGST